MPDPLFYRELDATSATAVARSNARIGNTAKVVGLGGALLLAGWMFYGSRHKPPPSMTAPDKDEFHIVQFPSPSIAQPQPQTDQQRIVIEPEPAAPPPPPAAPPTALPPPPAPEPALAPLGALPDDAEARRRAELEREAREAERRRWERYRAPMVIADNNTPPAPDGDTATRAATDAADSDPNRRFLAAAGSAGFDVSRATQNRRIDALIPQGTTIRAVLENAVQSDLPGMVRAVATEDVYSFDGRRVLIPAGTRLIGEYKSGLATGQTRVFMVWTRMLRSDGVSVQLGSIGSDELGRAGTGGFVDEHYAERFGSAILLSIVGAGSQYVSTLGSSGSSGYGSYGGYGRTITMTDPVTGVITTTQAPLSSSERQDQARQIAAQSTSQTMTTIAQEALRNSINIPPTIHLDQGTRVIVFVRRDLDFSAFYPDPVKEALRELKRARR